MSPDKPLKLLPESVRTFLEFGLKHVVSEQKAAEDEEQKKLLMLKFVRMTCVSNFYLNFSRRAHFDILNFYFAPFSHELSISFTSKRYDSLNKVSLSYDYARKLVNLLLPSYTGAYFWDFNENLFEQQSEILMLTKGNIGLDLKEFFNVRFAQKMLKTFAERIHKLHCPIKFFIADKSLQFPVLDYLCVDSLGHFDQIDYILKHKFKELEFGSISRGFAIEDEKLVDSKNETVKKLKLSISRISYVKFEKLVEYLRKSCLNLKHLDVEANFDDVVPVDQISNQVIDYVKRMSALKTRFEKNLVSIIIKFDVRIRVRGQRDSTWVETVCKSSEVNDWQVKSNKHSRGQDTLEMMFDDGRCKLEISVFVSTRAFQLNF